MLKRFFDGVRSGFNRKSGDITQGYIEDYEQRAQHDLSAWSVENPYSQNTQIETSLTQVRQDARSLALHDPWVAGAVQDWRRLPGTGVVPIVKVRTASGSVDEVASRKIQRFWDNWVDSEEFDISQQLCFRDLLPLATSQTPVDGEFFIRKHYTDTGHFGGSVEVVLPDQVDHMVTDYGQNRFVRMGVYLDQWNRVTGYHVLRWHPFDSGYYNAVQLRGRGERDYLFVPADRMIHVFDPSRHALATRGICWFRSALPLMRDHNDFIGATVTTAKLQACIGAYRKDGEPQHLLSQEENEYPLEQFLQPGAILEGDMGMLNPTQPSNNATDFSRHLLSAAARAFGRSYHGYTGDHTQSTYSSSRMAAIAESEHEDTLKAFYNRRLCDKLFGFVVTAGVLSGKLNLPDFWEKQSRYTRCCTWQWPGHLFMDPVDDITAAEKAMVLGLVPHGNHLQRLTGMPTAQVIAQIQEEQQAWEGAGLGWMFDKRYGRMTQPTDQLGATGGEENGEGQ